jgi:uncharacterized protein (DUF608 family)
LGGQALFDVPEEAERGQHRARAGGLGTGGFHWAPTGEFRGWRLHGEERERDSPVQADAFHLWMRFSAGRRVVSFRTEAGGYAWAARPALGADRRTLFPLVWNSYPGIDLPLQVENVAFSPLIPGAAREASLPVYVVAWRVRNLARSLVEVSLMLTWGCGWPDLRPGARFELQQDNLCITGSLGEPSSQDRMGIAVPDLHGEGVALQGVEPWDASTNGEALFTDFERDGELDPAVPSGGSAGAAAWVKVELAAEETREIPFIIAWSFPGGAGAPRQYTQFLQKRRPDNAIVWLTEESVQRFGQDMPNYRFWMQQIRDRQRSIDLPAGSDLNSLWQILEDDVVWPAGGAPLARGGAQTAAGIRRLWPDIARTT